MNKEELGVWFTKLLQKHPYSVTQNPQRLYLGIFILIGFLDDF